MLIVIPRRRRRLPRTLKPFTVRMAGARVTGRVMARTPEQAAEICCRKVGYYVVGREGRTFTETFYRVAPAEGQHARSSHVFVAPITG